MDDNELWEEVGWHLQRLKAEQNEVGRLLMKIQAPKNDWQDYFQTIDAARSQLTSNLAERYADEYPDEFEANYFFDTTVSTVRRDQKPDPTDPYSDIPDVVDDIDPHIVQVTKQDNADGKRQWTVHFDTDDGTESLTLGVEDLLTDQGTRKFRERYLLLYDDPLHELDAEAWGYLAEIIAAFAEPAEFYDE